jgi:lysophospholipase L1-like esterase
VLSALELHPRPGDQRDRRAVHRDVHLRLAAAVAALPLLLLAGCGSGEGGDHTVVAALGDSITAGNPGYDPSPVTRKRLQLGDDPESQWEYWAQQEHPELTIRNCGVRGERTDEIVQRLDQCAQGAEAMVVQGGVNDLDFGIPVEAVAANLRGMVRAAKDLNLDVAIADVLPVNPAHPQADPLIDRLNREIGRIGAEEGIPVLPFHDTLEDPESPGLMKREWTADGLHPSVEGYRRLGEIAFQPLMRGRS